MFKSIDKLWKVNAVIAVFLSLVTGINFASEMYVPAMFAAFSTGFAVATTITSVMLDIALARAVPFGRNTNDNLRKWD